MVYILHKREPMIVSFMCITHFSVYIQTRTIIADAARWHSYILFILLSFDSDLQAMSFLCHLDQDQTPFNLGHVQAGNISVEGDICQLGGFENTLLGFRTRDYWILEEYRSNIDIIMFGKLKLLVIFT